RRSPQRRRQRHGGFQGRPAQRGAAQPELPRAADLSQRRDRRAARPAGAGEPPVAGGAHALSGFQLRTIGQLPSLSGRNAWSAGMVRSSLRRSHFSFDSAGFLASNKYIGWMTRPSARIVLLPKIWSWTGISFISAIAARPLALALSTPIAATALR